MSYETPNGPSPVGSYSPTNCRSGGAKLWRGGGEAAARAGIRILSHCQEFPLLLVLPTSQTNPPHPKRSELVPRISIACTLDE